MKKLIEWAAQQSYKTITAEVAKDNEASCGLMTKLGFIINEENSFKKYHMDISYDSYVFEYSIWVTMGRATDRGWYAGIS